MKDLEEKDFDVLYFINSLRALPIFPLHCDNIDELHSLKPIVTSKRDENDDKNSNT